MPGTLAPQATQALEEIDPGGEYGVVAEKWLQDEQEVAPPVEYVPAGHVTHVLLEK